MKPSFPTITINSNQYPYRNMQMPTKISVSQANVTASQCSNISNPSIKLMYSQPTNSTFQQSQQSINSHSLSHVNNKDLSTSHAISIIDSISPHSVPFPSYTQTPTTCMGNKYEGPVKNSKPSSLPHTYTTPQMHESYTDLIEQNIKLKKIIKQEYLPLKNMYSKLKQQSEDREYLISQLEWKVKQLAKEIKRDRNI